MYIILIHLGSNVVERRTGFEPFELVGGHCVFGLDLEHSAVALGDLEFDLSARSTLKQL